LLCWLRPALALNYQTVATSPSRTCAIKKSNGHLLCWGDSSYVPSGLGPVVHVAVGDKHTCAITEKERLLECWGDNSAGQTTLPEELRDGPTSIPVLMVACAGRHTCAIAESSKQMYCYGTSVNSAATVPDHLETTKFDQVVTGTEFTCGISEGELHCWGDDNYVDLYDFTRGTWVHDQDFISVTVSQVVASPVKEFCALRPKEDGGSVLCTEGLKDKIVGSGNWGRVEPDIIGVSSNALCYASTADMLECSGSGSVMGFPGEDGDVAQLVGGISHMCGVWGSDADLYCWGTNQYGQIDVPDGLRSVRSPTFANDFAPIAWEWPLGHQLGKKTWLMILVVLCVFCFCRKTLMGPISGGPKTAMATPLVAPIAPLAKPAAPPKKVTGLAGGTKKAASDRPAKKSVFDSFLSGDTLIPPPPYWENQNLSVNFDERYDGTSRTMEAVTHMIVDTFSTTRTRDRKSSMPKSLNLISVQRIEDRNMWLRYQRAKANLKQKRGRCPKIENLGPGGEVKTKVDTIDDRLDEDVNECFLWHGSTPEGAIGISEDGFDLSRAGSHAGTMFGSGAYLAECSSKSDEYAHDGQKIYKNIYALILCRATCGSMYYTQAGGSRAMPKIEAAINSGNYDSVLGDREAAVGTYREFVVFDSDLIYPEFVCLYKKVF